MADSSRFTWQNELTGQVKTMTVRGHLVLARRCLEPEENFLVGDVDAAGEATREAQLVVDSVTQRGDLNWFEVLAVGPRVGMVRDEREMERFRLPDTDKGGYLYHWPSGRVKRYAIPRGRVNEIEVGDFVILPECSRYERMWRGVTGSVHDVLVDECEIQLRCPAESVAGEAEAGVA